MKISNKLVVLSLLSFVISSSCTLSAPNAKIDANIDQSTQKGNSSNGNSSSNNQSGQPQQIVVNVNNNPNINTNVNPNISNSSSNTSTTTNNNANNENRVSSSPSTEKISSSPTISQTSPTPLPEYKPPIILFDSLEIKEQRGNGDNIPNKGEEISLIPTFVNKGGVSSNPLTIKLSSSSSFLKVIYETDYIESLKPNAPKKTQGSFNIEIDKSVNTNTEIPLDFKLTDSFGNEYTTKGSFIVR